MTEANDGAERARIFRAALLDLEGAAADNIATGRVIQERILWFRAELDAGRGLAEIVEREEQPRLVELISQNMDRLHTLGAQFRATQAHVLRDEGLTMDTIAQLFGLTRQRISALLRQKSAPTP